MSLPPLASPAAFEARLGAPLDGLEADRAAAALQDASARVREFCDRTWVDAFGDLEDIPDLVVAIVCAVARRAFDNPEGFTSESETLGQHTESYSRANSSPDVYLTKSERDSLRSMLGRSGLGVISLTRGPLETRPIRHPLDGI